MILHCEVHRGTKLGTHFLFSAWANSGSSAVWPLHSALSWHLMTDSAAVPNLPEGPHLPDTSKEARAGGRCGRDFGAAEQHSFTACKKFCQPHLLPNKVLLPETHALPLTCQELCLRLSQQV